MDQPQPAPTTSSPRRPSGVLKWILVILAIVILGGSYWYYRTSMRDSGNSQSGLEKSCIDSGGEVVNSSCCKSVSDFPNTCLVGACGCAPDSSHEIKTCQCGPNQCFNGKECVGKENQGL